MRFSAKFQSDHNSVDFGSGIVTWVQSILTALDACSNVHERPCSNEIINSSIKRYVATGVATPKHHPGYAGMLEVQPQERETPPNTVRAHRKPVRPSPPFGTYNPWRLEHFQESGEPEHIKPALT